MPDFASHIAEPQQITESAQKKAGTPIGGTMDEEHRTFMVTLAKLIDDGEIDPYEPKSFLKLEAYDALSEEWKDKTDLALANIAHQVRMIYDFYKSKATPNESPQYQTMVEHLWQSKQAIEEHYDVFKF